MVKSVENQIGEGNQFEKIGEIAGEFSVLILLREYSWPTDLFFFLWYISCDMQWVEKQCLFGKIEELQIKINPFNIYFSKILNFLLNKCEEFWKFQLIVKTSLNACGKNLHLSYSNLHKLCLMEDLFHIDS